MTMLTTRPQVAPISNDGKNSPADTLRPTVNSVTTKVMTQYTNSGTGEYASVRNKGNFTIYVGV